MPSAQASITSLPAELLQQILALLLHPSLAPQARVGNCFAASCGSEVLAANLVPILKQHDAWLQLEIARAREELSSVHVADWSWSTDENRQAWDSQYRKKMLMEARLDSLIVEMGRLAVLVK